jgi:hypothetical protein
MTDSLKQPHRFFERFINNDLEDLQLFLAEKQKELLAGKIGNIPESELSKFSDENGPATQLGHYYNLFDFDHKAIRALKLALKDCMRSDISEYYGLDFNSLGYKIHGWFNLDYKVQGSGVSPLEHPEHFHDHMGGQGSPVFHGYYCVNAEPSSTWYKIDGEKLFENINRNNRAIISETGHPHGRDDWFQNRPRITIAYDIAPSSEPVGDNWIDL